MNEQLPLEIEQTNIHDRCGIRVHQFNSRASALNFAYNQLIQLLSRKSIIFVSHSDELIELYKLIALYEKVDPMALVMFEEVMGRPFHMYSYEYAYRESGLIDMLSKRGVPFFRVLARCPTMNGTVRVFSSRIRELMRNAEDSHAILEIKKNGELGGLVPSMDHVDREEEYDESAPMHREYVVGFRHAHSDYDEDGHISISYRALKNIGNVWVFAFGEDKRDQLQRLFTKRPTASHKYPPIMLRSCHGNVHLFTDLQV